MNVLDLFSGIGGFSLGLERAGMRTVAFCEIKPYCRAVLRKHWPNVPCYEDVRLLTAERLKADGISVGLICGGFPCQDISDAGQRRGLSGSRSGLWAEFSRLIREILPRYIIVENVAALRWRGLGEILGELAEIGYDAEWHCIPAHAVGAPIKSLDRMWILAYPAGQRLEKPGLPGERREDELEGLVAGFARRAGVRQDAARAGTWWESEPNVARVAKGIPFDLERIESLGNAVVPQIPEIIGRAIMQAEGLAP